jgi:hypothetical protein
MVDFVVSNDVDAVMKSVDQDAIRLNIAQTFDTDKNIGVTLTGVYQDIGNLTTPSRPAGTYRISFSVAYTYDSIVKSIFFQFRIDGGTWFEFRQEGKDIDDTRSFVYFYPQDFAAGVRTIELQARKEDAGDISIVEFADTSYERVGT